MQYQDEIENNIAFSYQNLHTILVEVASYDAG